jgi:hypothetical protein
MRIPRWFGELWTRVTTVASVPDRKAASPSWFAEWREPPDMFEIQFKLAPVCGVCDICRRELSAEGMRICGARDLSPGETCDICRRTATLTGLPARHIGEMC